MTRHARAPKVHHARVAKPKRGKPDPTKLRMAVDALRASARKPVVTDGTSGTTRPA